MEEYLLALNRIPEVESNKFRFISHKFQLKLFHCDDDCYANIGAGKIKFECSKCGKFLEIEYNYWMNLEGRYNHISIMSRFDTITSKLEKLEETVYNTSEYKALKIIQDANYEINEIKENITNRH